jgi:MFS family permease
MVADAIQLKPAASAGLRRFMTGVLFMSWVTALTDRMIIIMLAPGIKASLHLSDTQISLLYGLAFSLFFALAGLLTGRMVDSLNRRNLLFVGMLGWGAATIACGLADSFAGLFAARLGVGLCQAILAPASLSMVNDYSPEESRGRTTSLLVSGASVGAAVSNMLGGVVLDLFASHPTMRLPLGAGLAPWQSTFIVAAVPGLLTAVLLLGVPEPERRGKAADEGFGLTAYLTAHRAALGPLYAAFGLTFITAYGLTAWYPVLFMRNLGVAPHQTGLLAGVVTLLAAAVAAWAGGAASDRAARRDPAGGRLRLMRVTILLTALSQAPLVAVGHEAVVIACFFAYATLSTATTSMAYTVLPELAPNEGRGRMIALFLLIGYVVGLGLAPTAIALVTDRVLHDEMRVNLSMLIVCLPAQLAAALLVSVALPAARRLRESRLASEDC